MATNTKLVRLKETLKNILMQFEAERITTDKGIIDIQKAGNEIAVGDTAMILDEDGNENKIEDGEYILTNGDILRIVDGKIEEIVIAEIEQPEEAPVEEVVEEPAPEEEPKEEEVVEEVVEEEKPVEVEEEPKEEEVVEEPAVEEPVEEVVEEPVVEEEPAENEEVARLRAEIAEKDARIAELEAEIAKLKEEPAAKPATEEFQRVNKIGKTGNEKLDNLAKFMKK